MARTVIAAGVSYFAAVFAVGFALGAIRMLIVVPLVGETAAEALELPLMLVAIVFTARWVVRRFQLPRGVSGRLPTGVVALALMLAAEFLVMLLVRGQGLAEYLASRDALALSLYALGLSAFALMPWLLGNLTGRRPT